MRPSNADPMPCSRTWSLGSCYFRTGSLWEWYMPLAVTGTVDSYTCVNCSVESVTLGLV